MPELPEVENVVRTLSPQLVGSVIKRATVLCPISIRGLDPECFTDQLAGAAVRDVQRRGKFIVCALDQGWYLVIHLRMTGQLILTQPMELKPRFARVSFDLQDGRVLWFSDMRKFGRLLLTTDPNSIFRELGPEPFDPSLGNLQFFHRLSRHKKPVKSLLLDQSFLAGLGNIYADESLFQAGLNPRRPAASLNIEEASKLLQAIREVLTKAIVNRGTTIANYVDASGRPGDNQNYLCVYGRAGQACVRCQTTLVRLRLSGRSTYYCPSCQPAAAQSDQTC
ncbi:MAG: bifunctional DNA-formamidopyrimidine glycosylase/DNA-(apurinic or apyrimidinic site) lyase [Anaerolineae bacterium]